MVEPLMNIYVHCFFEREEGGKEGDRDRERILNIHNKRNEPKAEVKVYIPTKS